MKNSNTVNGAEFDSKITRRTFLKKARKWAVALAAVPFLGFGYARSVETNWIVTNQVSLSFAELPQAFHGIRIVQFSDVHYGFHFGEERLDRLVDKINLLHADLICLTGDLFDSSIGSDAKRVIDTLAKLYAPLGKWAVLGNHDYIAGANKVDGVLTAAGFKTLTNASLPIERSGAAIRVAGVDDMGEGKPNIEVALKSAKPHEFVLLLSHAPDFADVALRYPVDLQLSGHSHGGQVRLPLIGTAALPLYGRKYVDGLYTLGGGKLLVYTNRGVGVSVFPVRFLCRPELTVFTLLRA